MSETKKRIYNRSTAIEAMMDLSNKLTEIDMAPFFDKIKEVIIFGSFAKGADKVHDLDVYLEIEEHREMDRAYWEMFMDEEYDPIKARYLQINDICRYLSGRRRIYSFHSNLLTDGDRAIALSDVHYIIMKDGQMDYDEVEKLFI